MKSNVPWDAVAFAIEAHSTQRRKYTNEPYVVHPLAVMHMVAQVPHTRAMLAAAVLHDVIEDCDVTLRDIQERFGFEVAHMVWDLTDQASVGNRTMRKDFDRVRLSRCSAEVQTIKVADLCDNAESIFKHDPDFGRVFWAEKSRLLDSLRLAHPSLRLKARLILSEERERREEEKSASR